MLKYVQGGYKMEIGKYLIINRVSRNRKGVFAED